MRTMLLLLRSMGNEATSRGENSKNALTKIDLFRWQFSEEFLVGKADGRCIRH
jgi:hypothetical protein